MIRGSTSGLRSRLGFGALTGSCSRAGGAGDSSMAVAVKPPGSTVVSSVGGAAGGGVGGVMASRANLTGSGCGSGAGSGNGSGPGVGTGSGAGRGSGAGGGSGAGSGGTGMGWGPGSGAGGSTGGAVTSGGGTGGSRTVDSSAVSAVSALGPRLFRGLVLLLAAEQLGKLEIGPATLLRNISHGANIATAGRSRSGKPGGGFQLMDEPAGLFLSDLDPELLRERRQQIDELCVAHRRAAEPVG